MERIEILMHIKKAQAGDQSSFDVLKEQYKPLIESCSQRRILVGVMNSQDEEDLLQEALVSFFRAVSNYDCELSGVEFGLYAKICIDNALVSFIRSYLKANRGQTVSLECKEGELEESDQQDDLLQSLVDREKEAELVRVVRAHLSDYENRIWWLYVSGKSISAIAAEIGAPSSKSVSNAIYRIRKKLRTVVGGLG